MRSIVLGVDGGGTKTDYLLFDTQGNMLACLRGEGTNHERLAGGMAELEKLLAGVLPPFLKQNGLAPGDIAGAVFGMAGVDVPKQKAALEGIVSRMGFSNFTVMNDSFIGIKAGSEKGYGVCAVNGTGNTIGGIDRRGNWLQVAGTGWISGVEGGAGRMADLVLRAVYGELFCLDAPTALTPLVMGLLRVEDPVRFIEAVYDRYKTGVVKAKDILNLLFQCANRGDGVAAGILRRVGEQNARCIAGCVKRLDFGGELDVVLVGSVMLKASCPIMLDTLKEETGRLTGKKAVFIPLAVPAAVGSVLWAMELALGRVAGGAVAARVKDAVRAEKDSQGVEEER